MTIFASNFWLWSIVALVGLVMLCTVAALMNFAGFLTPVTKAGEWIDRLPPGVQIALLGGVFLFVGYPWAIHTLWANATAEEIRREFRSLTAFPGAGGGEPIEQMGGLYDPTGTDGAYIIGWFGTGASADEVRTHYHRILAERGWTQYSDRPSAARFRDHSEAALAHYELVLALVQPGSSEIPAGLALHPTVFAVRLGAVDPRVTTQVAWFIDCLVRHAPTFPSCESLGWHPLEGIPVGPGSDPGLPAPRGGR